MNVSARKLVDLSEVENFADIKDDKTREAFTVIPRSATCRQTTMGNLFFLSVLCTFGIYLISGAAAPSRGDVTTNVPKKLWTNWAMYSPYFAADKYKSAPNGCRITQACNHLLLMCSIHLLMRMRVG